MKQKLLSALRGLGRALMYFIINLLVIGLVMSALGALFMWLWNLVMPDVFDLPPIDLLQAILLLILINVSLISIIMSKYSDND